MGAGHRVGLPRAQLRAPDRRGGAADQRQVAQAVRGRGDRRPLGADFQIGAAESDWGRIANVVPPPPLPFDLEALDPASPVVRTFTGPPVAAEDANTPGWRRADIGAANGHGNARSVARVMSVVARGGEVDGVAAQPGNHRLDLPRADQRHRPGARHSAAVRHRLRTAPARHPAVDPGREDLFLGRLGRLHDRHGRGPPDDGLLHDEQDGPRHRRLRRSTEYGKAIFDAVTG